MNTQLTEKEDPGVEEVLDEVIDLEEYAKRGERPPLSKGYRIRVNGESFVVHDPMPTGRAILTLAGLIPPEEYTLRKNSRARSRARSNSMSMSICAARASRNSRRCPATRRRADHDPPPPVRSADG